MIEIRELVDGDAAAWWRLRLESLVAEPSAFGNSVEEHVARPVEVIAERLESPPNSGFISASSMGINSSEWPDSNGS